MEFLGYQVVISLGLTVFGSSGSPISLTLTVCRLCLYAPRRRNHTHTKLSHLPSGHWGRDAGPSPIQPVDIQPSPTIEMVCLGPASHWSLVLLSFWLPGKRCLPASPGARQHGIHVGKGIPVAPKKGVLVRLLLHVMIYTHQKQPCQNLRGRAARWRLCSREKRKAHGLYDGSGDSTEGEGTDTVCGVI